MEWLKKNNPEVDALKAEIAALRARIEAQEARQLAPIELKGRIEDLELWRGKIHKMLVENTPAGSDRLSRFGRHFRGKI